MNDDSFSEIINSSKDLTLGQMLKLIGKIKYKALVLIITTFLAITGSAYMAGRASVEQETAVMLQSPFSMRISVGDGTHDFSKLTLMEDPMLLSPSPDVMILSLRQIKSAFDISEVGRVVARIENNKVPTVWKWLFSSLEIPKAYAKDKVFDWNNHDNDHKYKEQHIKDHTIHRYYADDCILEYQLDNNRSSIPESFRWINRTH